MLYLPTYCLIAFLKYGFFRIGCRHCFAGNDFEVIPTRMAILAFCGACRSLAIMMSLNGLHLLATYMKVREVTHTTDTVLLEQHYIQGKTKDFMDDMTSTSRRPLPKSTCQFCIIARIAAFHDPRLDEKLGEWLDLTPKNYRGFSVLRLIVRNPSVGVATLVMLSDSRDDYLLGDIAAQNKTPVAVLRSLYD